MEVPTETEALHFSAEDLIAIAKTEMPFGKYQGTTLIHLPEAYLLWFARKSFPHGRLGKLMALCLEIKTQGLESIVKPLADFE